MGEIMKPRNIPSFARDLGGHLGFIRQHRSRPHPLKQSESEATFWSLVHTIMEGLRRDDGTLDLTRFIKMIEDEAEKKAAEYRVIEAVEKDLA